MGNPGVSLATVKTEILLLSRQRISTQVEIKVRTDAIATTHALKIIGQRTVA